ncbi:hypothetical protein TVAG_108240 [Trichomonas vaginalis G3]|uniref:Uncharacterized protein n=1 Tax=Trichomonas vaginalis (strain ATCC PRA-98 / G3) TaxID=412133 RepID=A2EQE8_TRIV3|nr:armadillo (ARM) repeat-containing protein family [Trichomonas vaginalis G3]EAY05090.1 hypothetical protein TVAG_108240 [Trichomonas vaginalis G3]KAI5551480.1 armadillo (ARM) repeat-containing protein family [Trichomonas vaginalis G3]|eukprot:XP_001317313.1 hypothetical protein [Trichomonas vaginalis G3]
MNFTDCFIATVENQAPSMESLEFLAKFKEENPSEYVLNLISLINNKDISYKVRIGAIKSLSIPIKSSRRIGSNEPGFEEERNQIYMTLEPYLQQNDEFDKACRSSLTNCLINVSEGYFRAFISNFVQKFHENTNVPLMLGIILDVFNLSSYILPVSCIEIFYNII